MPRIWRAYRVTGMFTLQYLSFSGFTFGITLHSLYRKTVSVEINFASYCIILTTTLRLHLFSDYTTLHPKFRKRIHFAKQYITVTLNNVFRIQNV